MATRRDVELGLQVTTAGSENVRRLKEEVDALARSGGDAAPEFQQLSQALDNLATQASALEAFDAIGRDVEALSLAQAAARENANRLGTELEQLRVRTEALRQAEQESLTTLRASQQALVEKRENLAILKANTDAAGRSEESYKREVREATLAIIALRSEIRGQSEDYKRRRAEVTAATAEEKKLAQELATSARQAQQASAALTERDRALRDANNTLRSLGVETDNLTASEIRLVTSISAVERELDDLVLAQNRAADAARRQAEEDARLAFQAQANAASYVNFWTEALREREAQEARTIETQRQAAEAAKQSAAAIQQAFGTVGVRSAQQLEREIQDVRTALELLRSSGTLTGRELDVAMATGSRRIKELERNLREATGQLTLLDRVSKTFQSTFGQTAAGFVAATLFQRIADSVFEAGRAFIDANKKIETLRLGLQTVYKDTAIADRQLQLLRDTANRAGVSFDSISNSFLRFSASLTGANIPLQQANALFQAVTQASGRLGLSGEQTNRVLDALSQIAAKGVVSMEELRQQLGDSLPGALSVAARGLGLTESQLIKLVESGELLARDFIPAFTQGLSGLQGEVNTLSAQFERLRNLVTLLYQSLGDAGAIDALKGALMATGAVLGAFAIGLNTLFEAVTTTVRATAAFAGTLVGGGGLKEALAAAGQEVDKSIERQARLGRAYQSFLGVAEEANAVTEQQVIKTASLRVAYQEVEKSLENTTKIAKVAVETAKQQSTAAEQLASALGTQVQQLEASARSADANAQAQQRLADAERTTLNVLIAKRDANATLFAQEQDALAAAGASEADRKKVAEDRAREIADLQKKIDLQAEVANRAQAQATASQIAAAAARTEIEATRDNSARVQELAAANDAARAAVVALTAAKQSGADVSRELAAAELQAAQAGALYRDALGDTIALQRANNEAKQAEFQLAEANLNLRMAQVRSLEATAKAVGDENLVTYAKIEAKRVEIQLIQAKIAASRAEAEGSILVAQATRAELEAKGELTRIKAIEIDTSIKIARAKLQEAKATEEGIKLIEREIQALRENTNGKNENTAASRNKAAALADEAGGRLSNAEAIGVENAALAEQTRLRRDAEGFSTDKQGNRIGQSSDLMTRTGIFNFLKNAGVDEANAKRLTQEFAREDGSIPYFNNPGQIRYGGRDSTLSQALLKAAESVTFAPTPEGATAQSNQPALAAPERAATAPAPTPSNNVRTIRLELNGSSTEVNVASDADASNLESFIQQLAQAKGRVA